MRLLIVEDEPIIRDLLKLYLKNHFEITEADNGRDGLKLSLEQDFDFILLDMFMPEMDGLEVWKNLRKQKDTPVLILTAQYSEQLEEAGKEAHTHFMLKPFSPKDVAAHILQSLTLPSS
ncbi:response regulator transcription factor [Bacillus sp. EB01]|uniref:response regulator transcription factor n=1 Tax=Bacillus sp. EB01 TaxID=1347086 RepID=UPI000693CEAA|nr:response regulator [Bacillus sp. EB01]